MFFPMMVGRAGASMASSRWCPRRREYDSLLEDLYDQTPVVVMHMVIGSATLEEKLRDKGLRIRVKSGDRELLTSKTIKASKEGVGLGAQYDFEVAALFALQGDEKLCLEVLKPHMVLPTKTIGRSSVSISELREAFGGMALTRAQGAVVQELLVYETPSGKSEKVLGTLQVSVSFEQTTLAALAGGDLSALGGLLRSRAGVHVPIGIPLSPRSAKVPPHSQDTAEADAYNTGVPIAGATSSDVTESRAGLPINPAAASAAATVVRENIDPPQAFSTADGGEARFESCTDSETGK